MKLNICELYDYADENDIIVDSYDLEHQPCISVMDEDGDCYIAIDPMQLESTADEKTKLAHELGHCVNGAFYNRYSPYSLKCKCEHKANKWAIKKLLPKNELEEAIKNNMQLWEIAELFGVNEDLIKKALWIYFDKQIA